MSASYYDACFAEGRKYEAFIYAQLRLMLGWTIEAFDTFHAQKQGENKAGIEIKYDGRMAQTGNVFIEVEERNQRTDHWVSSGPLRNDNTFLYLIGDYTQAFIFSRKLLVREVESGVWKRKTGGELCTSKGIIIPVTNCIELADRHIIFSSSESADDILRDL